MDPYRPPEEIADMAMLPGEIRALAKQGAAPGELTKHILRQQFGVLLGVFVVVWFPLDLAIAYLEQFHIADDDFRTSFRLQQQASLWFGVIATAAAISIIAATYDGRQQGFFDALGEGFRQWPKLWSTVFLYWAVCILGLIVLVVPGVIFAVRGLYAVNIAAVEDVYGPTAITRSFAITKGRFWETMQRSLVITCFYLLVLLVYACIAVPFEFFAIGAFDLQMDMGAYFNRYPWWYWLASAAITGILLVANVFAAVYVYCWYRRLDQIEFGSVPGEDTPSPSGVNSGNTSPEHQLSPQPERGDFKW